MKVLLLTIGILLTPILCAAQNASVSGVVTDKDGTELVGANIQIIDTDRGAISRKSGRFSVDELDEGIYEFRFSYIGFKPTTREVQIDDHEQEKELHVKLEQELSMPQITVIGHSPDQFERIPGSATSVTRKKIDRIQPVSGHEVFRKISGINAVDEEGVGLRANIGVRGMDPSRSRSVLMMEDGVPVALAPYGEPEMYYTPPMDRMEGVEVVKGSGSIKYGPQTFGGVVNYITPDPPSERNTDLHLRGGQGSYFTGRINHGNSIGDAGYNVNVLHKQGNEVGLLNFGLTDINSKLKISLNDNSILGAKVGIYDELSNSTYVGLPQQMYETGNYDFTHPAPDDQLQIRRYSGSISHDYYFTPDTHLQTTVYGYTTTRDWSRQDFHNVPEEGTDYERIIGNPDVDGGALYFLETTGNRNRSFDVFGVEPRFNSNFEFAGMNQEFDAGARYMFERAYEKRINGTVINPSSGDLRDDETRTGQAISAFLQNRTYLTDQLSVTPGIRMEYFTYERDVSRVGYENVDIYQQDALLEWIPGVGLNYNYADRSSVFAGVHRGFGPPRLKDAISVGQMDDDNLSPEESFILQTEELDAERSWNYEIGTRSTFTDGLDIELTGFYLDFSNQVIPVAEAAAGQGVAGASGLTNGGATRNYGIESGLNLDLGMLTGNRNLPAFEFSSTFTNATFSEDRFVDDDGETVNVKGNRLPYSPAFMATASIIQQFDFGLELNLNSTYTGRQYGDALNRETPSVDGREGMIDSHFLLDATATYQLPGLAGASLTVSVKNMLDERYIVSRRPQGIRLGMPRFITAGIDWNF